MKIRRQGMGRSGGSPKLKMNGSSRKKTVACVENNQFKVKQEPSARKYYGWENV